VQQSLAHLQSSVEDLGAEYVWENIDTFLDYREDCTQAWSSSSFQIEGIHLASRRDLVADAVIINIGGSAVSLRTLLSRPFGKVALLEIFNAKPSIHDQLSQRSIAVTAKMWSIEETTLPVRLTTNECSFDWQAGLRVTYARRGLVSTKAGCAVLA